MPDTAPQIRRVHVDESRIVSVDFSGKLDSGELLTGTPTVAEDSTSDFSVTNAQVSTTALTINGSSVAAGMAVQFQVDAVSGVSGLRVLDITVETDAGQTLVGRITIDVDSE